MKYVGVKSVKKIGAGMTYSIQNNEPDQLEGTPNFIVGGLVSKNSKHACVSGAMNVLTSKGYKPIKEIQVGDRIAYIDKREHLRVTKKYDMFKASKRKVYTIRTGSGQKIEATAEHRFFVFTENGIECRMLKDLNKGDKVLML